MKLIAFIACLLIGCASTKPPPPVQTPITYVGRNNLPPGWKEIKKDDWSFGVPSDYIDFTKEAQSFDVAMQSPDKLKWIAIETEEQGQYTLDAYISGLAAELKSLGAVVIVVKKGMINGNECGMIASSINSVIDFHLVSFKNNKVYNFDCMVKLNNTQASHEPAAFCSDVAHTLLIK